MIEGLRVHLSTEQLSEHLRALVVYWLRQADRIEGLLEMRGGGLSEGSVMRIRAQAVWAHRHAANLQTIARHLPPGEVFVFEVAGAHTVNEIEWPMPEERSDAEIERALFAETAHPFGEFLFRARPGTTPADEDP